MEPSLVHEHAVVIFVLSLDLLRTKLYADQHLVDGLAYLVGPLHPDKILLRDCYSLTLHMRRLVPLKQAAIDV